MPLEEREAEPHNMANIPLILDTNNHVLLTVKDSKAYLVDLGRHSKSHQKTTRVTQEEDLGQQEDGEGERLPSLEPSVPSRSANSNQHQSSWRRSSPSKSAPSLRQERDSSAIPYHGHNYSKDMLDLRVPVARPATSRSDMAEKGRLERPRPLGPVRSTHRPQRRAFADDNDDDTPDWPRQTSHSNAPLPHHVQQQTARFEEDVEPRQRSPSQYDRDRSVSRDPSPDPRQPSLYGPLVPSWHAKYANQSAFEDHDGSDEDRASHPNKKQKLDPRPLIRDEHLDSAAGPSDLGKRKRR